MSLTPDSILLWSDDPSPKKFHEPSGHDRESGQANNLKVLVVDDESTIAETLVEILTGEGFEALAACDGKSALEAVETFRPDVVVSDVVMPGGNGVELGIRIRQLLPKCRVILFSGQSATGHILREAQKRGHKFEIVAKPVKPQLLIAMILHRPS